jgi:hypothetical protein
MWLREAVSDDAGLADMAYISIGALTVTAIVALVFIFSMSVIDYATCKPITTVSKGDQSVTSVIPCRYDPLPLGQAAGLIFAAFAGLIGSLAGYMAATRRGGRRVDPYAPQHPHTQWRRPREDERQDARHDKRRGRVDEPD